ncbi:MAG: hypothetical protein NW217_15885 [Hyphomicrobiaceae bacterium]|nr:hypothetical protein [Hyphomicrobiaceae bacterium]
MNRPSDEILMAYADGQLSAEEHARVSSYLDSDPEAQEIVALFQRTRVAAREAFDLQATGRDSDLAKLILGMDVPGRAAGDAPAKPAGRTDEASVVVPFQRPARPQAHSRTASWRQVTALAASLALVVGAGVGYWATLPDSPVGPVQNALFEMGPIAPDSSLARLLEKRPTGDAETVTVSPATRYDLVAVATFRDKDGRACREFEAVTADAEQRPVAMGVACRQVDRTWRLEGAVQLTATATPDPGSFTPASGISEQSAMDGLMRLLGASAALTGEQERALIEGGWSDATRRP